MGSEITTSSLLDRVQLRLMNHQELPSATPALLEDLIRTASDRIKLRVGEDTLPEALESIAVEIVLKMYRRLYYEGISSETADTLRVDFVADIMAEYEKDFADYIKRREQVDEYGLPKVFFL